MSVLLLQPESFTELRLEQLLEEGIVSEAQFGASGWRNTLFPETTRIRREISAEHHITQLPITALAGWDVMEQQRVTRLVDGAELNAAGYPKKVKFAHNALQYGEFGNSVKRFRDLPTPLSTNYPGWESYVQPVLTWARAELGLTKIYCITEHRPFVHNTSYVLNAIYYTITGA